MDVASTALAMLTMKQSQLQNDLSIATTRQQHQADQAVVQLLQTSLPPQPQPVQAAAAPGKGTAVDIIG